MGENERWRQQPTSRLLPNGLLPNEAASVIRSLDFDRWSVAEQRTSELLKCIKPDKPSEDLRSAVVSYVQRLIVKCFPCEVFTYGSVPLKTYLPDGDIDLTAFSNNDSLKETWAHQVRDTLENEEKNENAEFHVKEVQYIQAEVKIIKCLVENIVVDISFNQLGGLCTLCFLEEVDNLISQEHLFKRSIILIKAWCYYESRVLGAHHGLISTYALETLVLYMFHVFNNSFSGPLEVLYRFLEFFSKFDWDNFCVSLWGPVPISSLPDVTAEPPRKDSGNLLLSKQFLDACSTVYTVYPAGQENQGQPFPSKYFNVIDPLRVNNNLGRSVSKGNFFRIRSAFAFGARKLARLLDCPKEDIYYEVNQFFMNTWDRHGSGHRPDAPRHGLSLSRLSSLGQFNGVENSSNMMASCHDTVTPLMHVHDTGSPHQVDGICRSADGGHLVASDKKNSSKISRIHDQTRSTSGSLHVIHNERNPKNVKPDNLAVDMGKYLFVRTRSSPELTDNYSDISRRDLASESGNNHSSAKSEASLGKAEVDNFLSQSTRSSNEDHLSIKHGSSRPSFDGATDSNSVSSSLHDLAMGINGEEFMTSLGSQEMQLEEQDRVNMMAASAGIGFGGHVQLPLNLTHGHMPYSFSSSVLTSMGYIQRNMGGMMPTSIPILESPWGTNLQFPQGLVSPPMTHYISGADLTQHTEDSADIIDASFVSRNLDTGESGHDIWRDSMRHRGRSHELDNGGFEMLQIDDQKQSASTSYDEDRLPPSGSSRNHQRLPRETRSFVRGDYVDVSSHQEEKISDGYVDRRFSRSLSSIRPSTGRSGSSESTWEGSSSKASRMARDKKGKKSTAFPAVHYARSKSFMERLNNDVDDDHKDQNALVNLSQHVSENAMHVTPMIFGSGACARSADNSGTVPLAFYPTGPPVPFVTMLPFYKISAESGSTDLPTDPFSRDGPNANNSCQNFNSSHEFVHSEATNQSNSVGNVCIDQTEKKCDILNSDFASHWQNLLYGRSCQNSSHPSPLVYQSPVMMPPVYLQSRFPIESPGRPLSPSMNLVSQLMSYGPRILPFAPMHTVSGRPSGAQKQFEEVPRYRSGTGTYLPNPKASLQERNINRKGNYTYGRSDHHGDRDGNWNSGKLRAGNRNHHRTQVDRTTRNDRIAGSENRPDRSWSSHKHNNVNDYQSQNGPVHLNSGQGSATNVTYGLYPIPSMSPGAVSSKGSTVPPVVMFYPYDHSVNYSAPGEHIEFGSLGPVGFSSLNDVLHVSECSRPSTGGSVDVQNFHGNSASRSSPDPPSSPRIER